MWQQEDQLNKKTAHFWLLSVVQKPRVLSSVLHNSGAFIQVVSTSKELKRNNGFKQYFIQSEFLVC